MSYDTVIEQVKTLPELAGKIHLDRNSVTELREASIL